MRFLLIFVLIVFSSLPATAQNPPANPGFVSSLLGKPADWPGNAGDLFKANFNYPAAAADMSTQPWMQLNPANPAQRDAYYEAVKTYALTAFQGDILSGCPKVANDWFHAPWLTFSLGASPADLAAGDIGAGREPICGLTQERAAPPGFLHSNQTRAVQSWAVGMFNGPGGFLLGRVWRNQNAVDLSETTFPNGTFIAKFLFTEADETQVPYLAGAPTWQVNIYRTPNSDVRQTKRMRLIQIDFGIRDPNQNATTGWVYGTFLYFNPTPGGTPADWTKNLIAVGSMWGNDHLKTNPAQFQQGALNPAVAAFRDQGKLFDPDERTAFGWFDRVNGPLDNPVSACLSCHATAQVHKTRTIKHFLTPAVSPNTTANRMMWFRNVKAGQTFTFTAAQLARVRQGNPNALRADWTVPLMQDFVSTDYSLQLRMAIENARSFQLHNAINHVMTAAPSVGQSPAMRKFVADAKKEKRRIERGGGP